MKEKKQSWLPSVTQSLTEPVTMILRSYRQLTGQALLPDGQVTGEEVKNLYHASFVVLAHDASVDPRFIYANLAAQRLFGMPWNELVGMPSRHSAEPLRREERQRLLERVSQEGFIADYSGVRIAKSGRRFIIRHAVVWNLMDEQGCFHGQAATFAIPDKDDWLPDR